MKLFKYSVLALALAAGFTACSDDDDYVPGQASDGVYFPTDDALEVTLDRNKTSFEVTVSRMGETAAATYALTGSADTEVFTLPTSVSFAQGETSTKVNVAYIPGNMGFDKNYTVTLGFGSDVAVSNYGYKDLEMSVVLPAPWTKVGTGTYTDGFITYGLYTEEPLGLSYECDLEQNDLDPTRYRWVHPYGDNFAKACAAADGGFALAAGEYDSDNKYYLEFYAKDGYAVIPFQMLGFALDADDGQLGVANEAGYILENSGISASEAGAYLNTLINNYSDAMSTFADGIFSTPAELALVYIAGVDGWYYGNRAGDVVNWYAEGIVISDFDLSLKYVGVLTDPQQDSYVLGNVTMGEDLASASVALVPTNDPEEALAAIRNGEIDVVTLEKSVESQKFVFDGSGDYVLAAIGYDSDGEEVMTATIAVFVVDTSAPKEWEKLGTATMIDGWVLPSAKYNTGEGVDASEYPFSVQVEGNIENPGIYRFIAPWTSAAYPLFEDNGNQTDRYNLVIDARNPAFVTIEPQNSGWYSSQNGWIIICSVADYFIAKGYSAAQITNNKYNNVFEDNVITITNPTFGVTNNPDVLPAAADCGLFWNSAIEVPATFALPGASQAAIAKAKFMSTGKKLEAKMRNSTFDFAKTFAMPAGHHFHLNQRMLKK